MTVTTLRAIASRIREWAPRLRGTGMEASDATFNQALRDAETLDAAYHSAAATARECERLTKALERLGSMEAFEVARAVNVAADAELLARISFARAVLAAQPEEK